MAIGYVEFTCDHCGIHDRIYVERASRAYGTLQERLNDEIVEQRGWIERSNFHYCSERCYLADPRQSDIRAARASAAHAATTTNAA